MCHIYSSAAHIIHHGVSVSVISRTQSLAATMKRQVAEANSVASSSVDDVTRAASLTLRPSTDTSSTVTHTQLWAGTGCL